MNSTSSDQSKVKAYSGLLISSIKDNQKLRSNINIPQLIDKERTLAVQNTLDAQAEEIKNLRQENQIILSQQQNQDKNENNTNDLQFLNSFASKTNIFLEHFDEFLKAFKEQEDLKINSISQQINKYKFKLTGIIQNFPNLTDLQSKENQLLQLQKNIVDLQKQNDTVNSINSQLVKTNNELKSLLQNAEYSNSSNSNLINELQKQVNEKDELIITLQRQNQEKDEKISSFRNSQTKSSPSLINQEYDDSESFNFTAHDSNPLVDSTSQKTIETLNAQIDQLKANLNEKDDYIQKVLSESQNEKSSLLLQIQQKNLEIDGLKSSSIDNRSILLLNQKIDEITKENQLKDDEINSLKQQISTAKYRDDQIKSLSTHVVSLADENSQLKEEIQNAQNLNQRFKEQIKTLQESKSLLNSANLDLNAKIDDLEVKLSQYQNQAQSPVKTQTNEIQEMKELLEKDNQKIKSLVKQVQDAFDHNEKIKNELISAQQENAELQNQNQINETQMKSIQFSNSRLESKLKNQEEINNQKDIAIQQLTDSNNELNERYEKLVDSHVTLKQQFEQSNINFSKILGCSPEINEITKQLTSCIERLKELQSSVVVNNDAKKEIAYLRQYSEHLNNQLKKKEEIIQSTLGTINLCRDGKESEVVKKYSQDFSELNSEYSNLIEEHKKLQNQMFLADSKYKEIESRLIDQQKINQELNRKAERIELYEFVTTHFIDFLSILSSSLISPLIQVSPVHKKRLSAVDNLRVQLKKKNFSSDRIIPSWDNFCSVIQESFAFDPVESINTNIGRIDYVIKTKMNLICKKIAENQKQIEQISNKSLFLKSNEAYIVKRSKKKPLLSLYEKSMKSPLDHSGSPYIHREKLSSKTPIVRANPLARKDPQNTFEPRIDTSFF